MSSILVAYTTGEGQTAKVAAHVADGLRERGHRVDVVDVARPRAPIELDGYDGVLLGASIHVGKHQPAVTTFATRQREALAARPSGFFQLCLSSAVDDPERRAEAEGYIEAFADATGWAPDLTASFGGALRYSEYGFVKRALMKRIAADATGDTDTSRDYEYTDWEAVDAFVDEFAALVEPADDGTQEPVSAAAAR